jgi:hypothetical protein
MAISQPNTWSQDAKPAPPQSGEGPDLINPDRPGKSRRPPSWKAATCVLGCCPGSL